MEKSLKSPLFVDLDGTFIKSDTLYESALVAIKQNPIIFFKLLLWLFQGKTILKQKLAECVALQTHLLPRNPEFHAFLKKEKNKRDIILSTGSAERYAKEFAQQSDIFSAFISSTPDLNLKGKNKLKKIQETSKSFSYAGNSLEDFEIFPHAEEKYLVNPSKRAKKKAFSSEINKIFDDNPMGFRDILKQVRIHQWFKNFLLFVPLLVSGKYLNPGCFLSAVIGFFSFSCIASATYIVNDLLDINSDRQCTSKQHRPVAAGKLGILNAVVLASILFLTALVSASALNGYFTQILLTYLLCTLIYSFKIKQHMGLDVITLAGLYTIRIAAGAAILSVPVSFWLLSFSMFIFFSLALLKRCAELKSLEDQKGETMNGRGYTTRDFPTLSSIGITSGGMALVTFCLFIQSESISTQYTRPVLIWIIIPVIGYWLTRMWIKTHRGEMHDDPIVFSITDRPSITSIIIMITLTILGKLL
ncbi:MAG: UbiA family prenyltransferase [Desulfobacterales bacterium]|nr:UbiA family prenyltransferase [Desulfobacterales bacterium]